MGIRLTVDIGYYSIKQAYNRPWEQSVLNRSLPPQRGRLLDNNVPTVAAQCHNSNGSIITNHGNAVRLTATEWPPISRSILLAIRFLLTIFSFLFPPHTQKTKPKKKKKKKKKKS